MKGVKMIKRLLALILLLGLLFTACGESDEKKVFFPERESVKLLSVCSTRRLSNDLRIPTTEGEMTAILDILYELDIESLADSEPLTGGTPALVLCAGEEESMVFFSAEGETLYVTVTDNEGNALGKCGVLGAFDYAGLSQAAASTFSSTSDPNYVGKLTGEDGSERLIGKYNSAYVQSILEDAVSQLSSGEAMTDSVYSVKFELCGNVYGIDPTNGCFYKEEQGERHYSQVSGNWLIELKMRLGISVPAE